MAIEQTYKIVTPKSDSNSDYEEFEYLLCWIDGYGTVKQHLFYDREINLLTDAEQINLDDSDYIGTFVKDQEKRIVLVAEDLTRQQYDKLLTITRTKKVWRLYKDGTYDLLSIAELKPKFIKSDLRYNFEIILNEVNNRVLR